MAKERQSSSSDVQVSVHDTIIRRVIFVLLGKRKVEDSTYLLAFIFASLQVAVAVRMAGRGRRPHRAPLISSEYVLVCFSQRGRRPGRSYNANCVTRYLCTIRSQSARVAVVVPSSAKIDHRQANPSRESLIRIIGWAKECKDNPPNMLAPSRLVPDL